MISRTRLWLAMKLLPGAVLELRRHEPTVVRNTTGRKVGQHRKIGPAKRDFFGRHLTTGHTLQMEVRASILERVGSDPAPRRAPRSPSTKLDDHQHDQLGPIIPKEDNSGFSNSCSVCGEPS